MASQKPKRPAPRKKKRTSASTVAASEPVTECGIGAPAGDLTPEMRQVMEENSRALEQMRLTSDPAMRLDSPVLDAMPDQSVQPSIPKSPNLIRRCLARIFGLKSGR